MKPQTQILLSVIVATAILITAYVANGSEYEDAWLYILAFWLVLSPALDLYFKKKKGKDQ